MCYNKGYDLNIETGEMFSAMFAVDPVPKG